MALALGIETSCDDTGISLVRSSGEILFNETCNQNSIHHKFGGIVPELASRNHSFHLLPLVEKALKKASLSQIDVIAVTSRPGLLGALQTGFVTGKTLGLCWEKPVVSVNHIEGHIFSPFLKGINLQDNDTPPFPFLALIVSGSHSHLYHVKDFGQSQLLGATLDDAAGEALDKFGKMLEFPWPGGPHIDSWAAKVKKNSPSYFSKIQTKDLSFSFSGIKSAGRRLVEEKSTQLIKDNLSEICSAYQKVVINHLMEKLKVAQNFTSAERIVVGGGVSANSLLRNCLNEWSKEKKVKCFFPEKTYCTDNAAMIAYTGLNYFLKNKHSPLICSPHHLKKDFFTDIHKDLLYQ